MNDTKNQLYRDNFPGYMGHIPLKGEIIGMTVGASNDHIKKVLTLEPAKDTVLKPQLYEDYSLYNKDYFNENFCRDYKLEEDRVYSNQSKEADTWIGGAKFGVYPQHIPGYKAHVPGIYSSNLHGMGFSKTTAVAVKGEYCKKFDYPSKERYQTTQNRSFLKPKVRSEVQVGPNEVQIMRPHSIQPAEKALHQSEKMNLKQNTTRIFKSKIANVPTPGYSGHTSIFHKPISYLNKEKIEEKIASELPSDIFENMSESFRKIANLNKEEDLPYIVGYKGFRLGVKSGNYYGTNFKDASSTARRVYKHDQ